MNDEPRDYGAHSATGEKPSIGLQQRAFDAVKSHSQFLEADSHAYCEPMLMVEPKSFLDRMKIPDKSMGHISAELSSAESVIILSFITSESQPEPLSGHGKQYIFLIHPETFEILHTTVGTWRS